MSAYSTSDPIHGAIRALFRVITAYESMAMVDWAKRGLTITQLRALYYLNASGGTNVRQLAETLHVSSPTVTGLIERLEQQGLVTRTMSSTDRRVVDVTLTEVGVDVVGHLGELKQPLIAALNHMPPDTVSTLSALLVEFADRAEIEVNATLGVAGGTE